MYRPQYHFTPEAGWMNDPNGLLYENGNYHLFYQYYPDSTIWGPMHWGHAVSTDLVHWKHLPIALYPDQLGLAFSGSACIHEGKFALIYTSHGRTEQQSLAWSEDGIHFTPYEGNPVIPNLELPDFRDPKVFADPAGGWSLVLAAGDRAMFYHSEDLIDWKKTGEFGPFRSFRWCVWECPSIVQVGDRWVMFTSVGKVKDKPLKDTYYWIGRFEDGRFIAETEMEIVDFARDDYAGVTFHDAPEPTFLAWASQWIYAIKTPSGQTDGFRGQMTYARKLSIVETAQGPKLAALPMGDLKPAAQVKVEGPFEIRLSNDKEVFRCGMDADGRIFMDRTGLHRSAWSRKYYQPAYAFCTAERFFKDTPCDFTLYVDGCVAELYVDGGTRVGTMLLYPKAPLEKVEIE